jgi:hemoglobin
MLSPPRDIDSREDCEQLVREFYARALEDPIIGWIFVDVARLDVEAHVPRIASFWETILLGARSYRGGAFAPHAALNLRVPLRAGHFERWLWLWRGTVDDLFAGDRAELAKAHAQRVARAFSDRLQAPAPASGSESALLQVQRVEQQGGVNLTVSAGDPAPRSAGEDPLLARL